jgi:hypothetical protein
MHIGENMPFYACPSCVELEGKLRGHHFEKQVKGMGSLVKKSEGVVTSPSCVESSLVNF